MWFVFQKSTFIVLSVLICDVLPSRVEPLLVAHNNAILQLGPNTSSVVVSSDIPVKAFDIHIYWRQLFWATDYFIYRTPLYDLQTTTLVAVTGEVSVGGLALDWIHQVVYWSNNYGLPGGPTKWRVEAAHLDGTGRRVVCERDWTVGALAVDPQVGQLFWIEYTDDGGNVLSRLKSSDTVGTNVEVLGSFQDIHPSGPLAVDTEYSTLYFYRSNDSVSEQWELRYGGPRPHSGLKLFDQREGPPRSLALTHDGFYYSNGDGLTLGRWQKKSYSVVSGNITANFLVLEPYFNRVDEELTNASQIRVFHSATQPRSQDKRDGSRCHHESSGPQAYECICRYGFSLKEDLKSCLENGYVLHSTSTTLGRITLEGTQLMTIFNDSTQNIQAFDVHVRSGYLFWADLNSQTIYRSSADTPVRSTAIVQNVSAYGLAVDWVHNNVYWSDNSRIMISSLDGTNKMAVVNNLDSPEDIAVDPINRYVFWTECGRSLSLKRASLDGEDIMTLKGEVNCGSTITLDLKYSVYWLDWMGTVHSCDYNGKNYNELFVDLANAIAISNGRLLLFSIEQKETFLPDGKTFFNSDFVVKPNAVRIVKTSQQPAALNSCIETECSGLCLPKGNLTIPLCLCPSESLSPQPCYSKNETKETKDFLHLSLLELVSITPFSVTLKCAGPLLYHPFSQPSVQVTEVESLVNRTHKRSPWFVRVNDKHHPFTIDTLNPATTYTVMLRNRVTRASFSLTVRTPPPPLGVDRLPLISLPEGPEKIKPLVWLPQGVHYFDPNPWQDVSARSQYILLLISKEEYYSSKSYYIDQTTNKLIRDKIKDNFVVLKHYKSKDEFDDDPVMHLGNIPWGQEFWLAMVQVTEYQGSQHLDFVFSDKFALPDPAWINLMNDILENNKEYEIKSCHNCG